MRELIAYWRGEMDRNWIIAPVLVVFFVTASFNVKMGYEFGGGADEFPLSLLYGIMFFGLAVLGAYGFAQAGSHAGGKKAALLAVGIIQLAVGLQAGWQSLGLTLAKGAVGLENKANTRQTADDALKAARAAREKIGTTRTVDKIRSEEVLECRKVSPRFPDGVGPECTKLRGELADAKRAIDLDAEIKQLTTDLGNAPRIKDAAANFEVFIALASAVKTWWTGKAARITPDDARFWFLVFMVAVLEIVGTLGFWLAGVHGSRREAAPSFDGLQRHPPLLSAPRSMADVEIVPAGPLPGFARAAAGFPVGSAAASPTPLVPLMPHGGGANTPQASSFGAPINIHVGGGHAAPAPAGQALSLAPPERTGDQPARAPRHDVGQVASPPPVDRSRFNALSDSLLAFRAACVVDVPGGHVTAADLYRRYVSWKGPSAIGAEAFDAMFASISGIPAMTVGGQTHYHNVALRAVPAVKAVAS